VTKAELISILAKTAGGSRASADRAFGAFVGGVASGSLHGWVWFAAALSGCAIGIRLRPLFGLSRE